MDSRTSKLLHLNPSSVLSLHFLADKGSKNILEKMGISGDI